jgi:plastocyanin
MDMPPASTPTSGYSNSGSGNGATHTVIVAPTQGVLRYVPFVLNASVGDTINFMWGANNHTVTKSSQLELCNKTSDAPFASGEHNKSFMCKNQSLRMCASFTQLSSFSLPSCQ